MNYEEIGKHAERITKTKPFINKYNWGEINYPSKKHDWKKYEENNVTIALIILYGKKEKIYPASVSKHYSNREKEVILLIFQMEKYGITFQSKKVNMALPFSQYQHY